MRKTMFVCFAMLCCCFVVAYAAESGRVTASLAPKIVEMPTPTSAATVDAAVYPVFVPQNATDNPACEQALASALSNKSVCTASPSTNAVDPRYCQSGTTQGFLSFSPSPRVLNNVSIGAEYRQSARLLVTWTVRVEGYAYEIHYWPYLCAPWHGSVGMTFPEGQVGTQLYINGKEFGKEVKISIPKTDKVVTYDQPYDPTLVGSYLITPEEYNEKFGGDSGFPDAISKIEVKWRNYTSMRIVSPAGMRSLTVSVLPSGDSREESD